MKAIWGTDYDFYEDRCYKRPCCPECKEPIGRTEGDENYYCFSCGKKVDVDDAEMQEWFKIRRETKTEIGDCLPKIAGGCGGKNCMEHHMIRNPVSLKWQEMGGKCNKCGMRFII